MSLTLASGIAVYVVMREQAQTILVRLLETSLQNNRRIFEIQINDAFHDTLTVSTRPFVISNLRTLNSDPRNEKALHDLQWVARSFLSTGLTGVTFQDARGREVTRAGMLSAQPEMQVHVNLDSSAYLVWDKQFLLHVLHAIVDEEGQRMGSASIEIALPHLTRALFDASTLGQTAALAVCAPREQDMQCFPATLSRQALQRVPRQLNGVPLPMHYALNGETGIAFSLDRRQKEVVAAYTPVGTLGLGMVLKIDRAELFAPVKKQLERIVPALVGLIFVGMLLLYWLVTPLVRKLVLSQQETSAANARLSDVEERARFALESTGAGVWDWNIPSQQILVSQRCVEMLGYTEDEMGNSMEAWLQYLHPEDSAGLVAAHQLLMNGEGTTFTHEHRKQRKDGDWIWVQERGMVVARDDDQRPTRIIGTCIDISERKQAEEAIRHQANFDPLTQLPNRRLFHDRLAHEMNKSRRLGGALVLLLIDLDHFKEVNDTLGHDAGDKLLQEAAHRIRDQIRDVDTAARLGGDEFTVILTALSEHSHIETIVQKILARLAQPFHLGQDVASVSASIGITLYPRDAQTVEVLIKNADQAMYAAKRLGRNCFSYFRPSF